MSDNPYDPRQQAPVPPTAGQQQGGQQPQQGYQPNWSYAQGAPQNQQSQQQAQGTQQMPYGQTTWQPTPNPGKYGKKKEKEPGKHVFWKAFGGAACACVLAGACMFGYQSITGNSATGGSTVVLGSQGSSVSGSDDSNDSSLSEQVADKVLPSVVSVTTYVSQSQGLIGQSQNAGETEYGAGSGVIISNDGYILTNYHVIEGTSSVKVTADGQEYDAQVVGYDSTTDLAVLKIDASNLTAIGIGDSSNLKAGQWVMTAGNPFGLEQSVATGIVSATDRTITVSGDDSSSSSQSSNSGATVYTNMIQTDAAINPGNSGGALVDSNGNLIGINAVIESYSGNYSGVGFAIPVNTAMDVAQQIINGETPTHAVLGVYPISVTSELNQRYNLGSDSGAYVNGVTSGSGAESAGLQQGDIITKVDDTQITDSSSLISAVRSHNVGDTVTVTFLRNGQEQTAQVTLGSDEDETNNSSSNSSNSNSNGGNGYGFGYGSPYGNNGSGNGGNGYGFGFGF